MSAYFVVAQNPSRRTVTDDTGHAVWLTQFPTAMMSRLTYASFPCEGPCEGGADWLTETTGRNFSKDLEDSFGRGQEPAPRPQSDKVPPASPGPTPQHEEPKNKAPKRILWIIPNYRSVSADTRLPRLSFKGKVWLATEDSFDYSSFLLAGMVAGAGQAQNSIPEFHQQADGYGRYYWHSFADQAVGNYMTETIVPVLTLEDPRYYTLGHGGVFRRTGYAVTRLLVTRTDHGGLNFNFSEIVGNGGGAGISDLYYPRAERTLTKTYQKWATQVAIDGVFNIFKEFWPDIDRTVFRGHY
jgi:hypothetical protein